MEMSQIAAAAMLLGGSPAASAARSGGGPSPARVRYGTVKAVEGGVAEIELADTGATVWLRTDTPLRAGDRATVVAQGGVTMVHSMAATSAAVAEQGRAVKTLAESFSLLSEEKAVRYRVAGEGGEWKASSRTATWYVLKPTAVEGAAPMLFWCSVVLTAPLCNRAFGSGFASYYEYMVDWPASAGVTSNDRLPQVHVGASCEGDVADAYSWNRGTDGLGPLILVARSSGSLPATRMEVFCFSRV